MLRSVHVFESEAGGLEGPLDVWLAADGTIEALTLPGERPAVEGTRELPAAGQTLLPGLVDVHTHLMLSGQARGGARLPDLQLNVTSLVAAGITTTLNTGDWTWLVRRAQRAVASGRWAGPEVYGVAEPVTVPGSHPMGSSPSGRRRAATSSRSCWTTCGTARLDPRCRIVGPSTGGGPMPRTTAIAAICAWLSLVACPDGRDEPCGDDDTADAVCEDDDDSVIDDDDDSALPHPCDDDADGDGWTVGEGDCLDTDPDIHPDAAEVPCDQLDNDCDPTTSDSPDADGDLYDVCIDCDDSDPAVHPAAPGEVACDGIDTDCDTLLPDLDRWVPTDYPSIQDAIDASDDGDAICVAPGTWAGPLDFGGRSLQLIGPGGAEATIIDAGSLGPVVDLDAEDTNEFSLQGLTLTGGLAENGAGVFAPDGFLTLNNVRIHGCEADELGGGIFFAGMIASLSNVVIEDNTANQGGGIAAYLGQVDLTHGVVARNVAVEGGGVYFDANAVATLQNVTVYQNHGQDEGGGAYVGLAILTLGYASLINNTGGDGAGIMAGPSAYGVLVSSTQIWGNVADAGHGALNLDSTGYGLVNYNNFFLNFPDHCAGCETWVNQTGQPDFLDVDPIDDMRGWDQHLAVGSAQLDTGEWSATDPDGSRADIGIYGGPLAGEWDLDGDGYPAWWRPGPYDASTSPDADCDDEDPTVFPGSGC